MTDSNNNDQQQLYDELNALRKMLNKGVPFTVPSKSILRFIRPERTFKIYKPFLGTLDHLAELSLKMVINQAQLDINPINAKNRIIKDNTGLIAEMMGVCYLNSAWKISLFRKAMKFYFKWHMDSEKTYEAATLIDNIQDAGNFINSIALMAGLNRTSQPKPPIEEKTNQKE